MYSRSGSQSPSKTQDQNVSFSNDDNSNHVSTLVQKATQDVEAKESIHQTVLIYCDNYDMSNAI